MHQSHVPFLSFRSSPSVPQAVLQDLHTTQTSITTDMFPSILHLCSRRAFFMGGAAAGARAPSACSLYFSAIHRNFLMSDCLNFGFVHFCATELSVRSLSSTSRTRIRLFGLPYEYIVRTKDPELFSCASCTTTDHDLRRGVE